MKFLWSSEAQRSHEKLKEALTQAPVLVTPSENEQIELHTEANSVRLCPMLAQSSKAFAYASPILNSGERNYAIIERE